MREAIAVLNAGSSSLKFALFLLRPGRDRARRDPVLLLRGQIEGIGRAPRLLLHGRSGLAFVAPPARAVAGRAADHAGALDLLLDWFEEDRAGLRIVAAGHRVVHGGDAYNAPQRVGPELIAALAALGPLAPQHQPHNVAAIAALAGRRPDLPQVACFDTAFHATQPPVASTLPLPRGLRARGLRRYGFHGLSYEYVLSALPGHYAGQAVPRRVVVAHLGNGASMCAVEGGRSVATTMGFSALDGLMMGTRCGSLDPGVILHLMREEGMDLAALTALLYDRSGLLGVSGISADMRRLLDSDRPEAAEAVELFCYRIARELGSLAAALGGLDALVFTGGIGEHAGPVRAAVCRGARWLGVELDENANALGGPCLTRPSSPVKAWVIPTNEELVIARHTRTLVA
ncbi:MAG: acetate/propionate family kinase [Kiloniellaceae bacterium]